MLNFWVDAIIAVAFLVCAVSGIVFLLPLGVRGVSASGVATIFGIGVPAWHAVHDWSAVTIVAGLGLHCALHYRWIVNVGRRALGGLPAAGSAPQRTPQAPRSRPVDPSVAPVTMYRAAGAAPAARRPSPADVTPTPQRATGAERRYTRGAFLTGAAGLAGSALLVGLIAARDRSQSAATASTAQSNSSGSPTAQTGGGYGSGYGSGSSDEGDGYAYGYGDGSQQSGGSAAPGGAATGVQVSVDPGACVACGACLQVCPANVFAWSGGKATAADPGACIRCGRCLQACPVSAITVSA
jgi:NAD-dependent dihydropyrimidine dehydrogenase PreA subunit